MSSLSAKDRVSLCMFSFADGRRCRTPRLRNHPYFCYDHAEKEARARAAQSLGTDLARYFSGNYLSACDLSTALGCLIPAVVRGDVKPKVARTVAYMAQTLLQSIHISQHEYCEAFGTNAWRNSIGNSVNSNHNYRFPPRRSGGLQAGVPPQPQHPSNAQPQPTTARPSAPPKPAQTPVNCHSECSEESAFSSSPASPPQPKSAQTPVNCHSGAVAQAFRPEEPAFSPNSSLATHHSPLPQPLPPTAAEFAHQVLARRNSSQPDRARSVCLGETAGEQTAQPVTSNPKPTPPTQAPPTSAPNAAPPADKTPPVPATQAVDNPPNPKPPTPKRAPHRDHYAVHYDHTCPLRIDGKLV
jgi:hypothetical protein